MPANLMSEAAPSTAASIAGLSVRWPDKDVEKYDTNANKCNDKTNMNFLMKRFGNF